MGTGLGLRLGLAADCADTLGIVMGAGHSTFAIVLMGAGGARIESAALSMVFPCRAVHTAGNRFLKATAIVTDMAAAGICSFRKGCHRQVIHQHADQQNHA
jgi:hypothetical protein